MKSDRKANIIKALRNEILARERRDKLSKPTMPITLDRTELTHLRLKSSFSAYEVSQMPKDVASLYFKIEWLKHLKMQLCNYLLKQNMMSVLEFIGQALICGLSRKGFRRK